MEQAAHWWRQRHLLQRFVGDLIAGELSLLRRHASALPPQPWAGSLAIDRDLGADSLELLHLAAALAEAIHLHRSGIEDYLLARRTLDDWVDLAAAGLEQFSGELTFRTSGSAGTPKACVHSLAALLQEAGELAALFAGRRRILVAVPAHHIYGFLFSVLLPGLLGLPAGALVSLRASSPAGMAGLLRHGDLVIGHPEFWRAAGRSAGRLPAGVIGVSSTAPCPDAVSEAAIATGLEALVQVYGASETAGIGWRADHRTPYSLFQYWQRGGDGLFGLVRTLPDGARLPAQCQDHIEWLGPDTFRVAGRRDTAVQVGGVNVFPARVAELLRQHPLVDDAVVRLMRADEGSRLKAFVVPAAGVADLAHLAGELSAWSEQALTAAERPRAFNFGAHLPRSTTGKAADWLIDA